MIRRLLFLTIICTFFITCSEPDEDDYKDVEVTIILVSNYGNLKAQVYYTVENIGTKSINGWTVAFNVNLDRGASLTAYERVRYVLEPEEISSEQLVEVLIR